MIRLILLTILATLGIAGCKQSHLDLMPPLDDPSIMGKKLTVAEMHQDIDAFVAGVLERHPEISEYADEDSLYKAVTDVKAEVNDPMTRTEFYRVIGKLNHRFNDGHSLLIWPYPEFQQLRDLGHKPFPFEVAISATGDLYFKHSYQSGELALVAGTQILAINGVVAPILIDKLQQYRGGESRLLREQIIARRFGLSLWAGMGFIDDFELEIALDGKVSSLSIRKDQPWRQTSPMSALQQGEHYYKQLQSGVGLLYLAHFDIDPAEFEDFIDQTFVKIKQEKIHSLIIDIRDNTGGNTDTVTYLSRHLADKPFRLISSVREKLNQDNRGWFNYKGRAGEIITKQWQQWEKPVEAQKGFSDDVYLMVGPITYSAAIVLATTLEDHQFATLVGEKSGGFANQTAQGNLFNLPHSQLRAYVATRILVRPNGDSKRHNVEPHHVINRSPSDIKTQNDAGIQRVLELINDKQANDA